MQVYGVFKTLKIDTTAVGDLKEIKIKLVKYCIATAGRCGRGIACHGSAQRTKKKKDAFIKVKYAVKYCINEIRVEVYYFTKKKAEFK